MINLLADEETPVDMDLDLLLSDMTLNPNPVRFDGVAPEYAPEKPMLAAFGTLTGLLPESLDGQSLVDKLYFFINDHLGTPMIVTDETGTVVWKADYQPFGKVDIVTGDIENNLRFAGQYFDAETGLHYNYHRYYDPATGRYLTADPIGFAGGINLFAYTHNNPINMIDPDGLIAIADDLIIAGGALIIGAAYYAMLPPDQQQAMANDVSRFWDWLWTENTEDGNGNCEDAQAPGQPTEKDGFVPPKNWDGKKVKAPNGRGYGWPDKKGNVWVPTGPKGHGGEHWDVQKKKGGYVNVYPGGKVRP